MSALRFVKSEGDDDDDDDTDADGDGSRRYGLGACWEDGAESL